MREGGTGRPQSVEDGARALWWADLVRIPVLPLRTQVTGESDSVSLSLSFFISKMGRELNNVIKYRPPPSTQ